MLPSFSNHQTELYEGLSSIDHAWMYLLHRWKAGTSLCAIKELQENRKMLQVHVTFMGHYNFSNIIHVNVMCRYIEW
jgi:hypothetical protein